MTMTKTLIVRAAAALLPALVAGEAFAQGVTADKIVLGQAAVFSGQ